MLQREEEDQENEGMRRNGNRQEEIIRERQQCVCNLPFTKLKVFINLLVKRKKKTKVRKKDNGSEGSISQ